MLPLECSALNGVNPVKLLYFPRTKSISCAERQDSIDCDCDYGCDYDCDGCDVDCDKKIPGTSCGDLGLLINFGLSGTHLPAEFIEIERLK